MNQILSKQYSYTLALLLVLLIVAQNLFPIQAHTKTVVTDSGRTIIVCTLEGLQTISLDEFGQEIQQHQTFTAATQFSELMSTATTAVKIFQISPIFIPSIANIYFATTNFKQLSKNFQLIRAPPLT